MIPTDPSRRERLATLRTLRDLQRSVAAGRAMSLPTMLRLAKRRGVGDVSNLRSIYLNYQPFRRPWQLGDAARD